MEKQKNNSDRPSQYRRWQWALILLLALVNTTTACYPHDEAPIPEVYVDSYLDLLDPYYNATSFEATYDYEGNLIGNGGIVVYYDGYEYYAFDRMCPYENSTSCLVYNMGDGTAICPDCHSVYLIASPSCSVISGPSPWSLKRYNTRVVKDDFLHIYN